MDRRNHIQQEEMYVITYILTQQKGESSEQGMKPPYDC